MDQNLASLLTAMLRRHFDSAAELISSPEMPQQQGFSGATLRRYAVSYATPDGPSTTTLLTKESELVERQVLDLLNRQGHAVVPRSHSLDLHSPAPALLCMAAVDQDDSLPAAEVPRLTAAELAAIHVANLGCGARLPWLPAANHQHLAENIVQHSWRLPWQASLGDPAFASAYGQHTAALEAAAECFVAEMDALWQAGDSLTLIHADLQPYGVGGHLLVHSGQPYIVDWGQARYGSFFLDLPNLLTPTTVEHYRQALAEHGIVIPQAEWRAHYRAAGRYVGFKFLSTLVWLWEQGSRDEAGVGALDFMIQSAIHGRLPHRWSGSGE